MSGGTNGRGGVTDRPHLHPRADSINSQPTSISPTSPEAILTNPVIIVGYDPSWPATFQQLRDRLGARLCPLAIAIEHIGSTAVPGLAAKPIIDLDVVIADRTDLPTVIQRLRPLGYHHEGDLGVPGREAFTTPAGAPPHHLYVCAVGASAASATSPFATPSAPTPHWPRPTATSSASWPPSSVMIAPASPRPRPGSSRTCWLAPPPRYLASQSTPTAYERRARQGPCFVCQTLAGHRDYPAHLVWTDDFAVAFLARYNTLLGHTLLGHTLVAPRAHREQVTGDFTIEEYLALQRLAYRVGEAIRQELAIERLYIMSLGSQSGNRHLHWHVAPLPPGLPYQDQQLAAFSWDRGILALPDDDLAPLASRIGARVEQLHHPG